MSRNGFASAAATKSSKGSDELASSASSRAKARLEAGRSPARRHGRPPDHRDDESALSIARRRAMHACDHDRHGFMLLGDARNLAKARDFSGTVILLFSRRRKAAPVVPGAVIDDGLMKCFGIDEIYGTHNWLGYPVGSFAIRTGSIMAAFDSFSVEIEGEGGHARHARQGRRHGRSPRRDRECVAVDCRQKCQPARRRAADPRFRCSCRIVPGCSQRQRSLRHWIAVKP